MEIQKALESVIPTTLTIDELNGMLKETYDLINLYNKKPEYYTGVSIKIRLFDIYSNLKGGFFYEQFNSEK